MRAEKGGPRVADTWRVVSQRQSSDITADGRFQEVMEVTVETVRAALAEIEAEAGRRRPLEASLIIHRYGRLEPGEQIVLVITASAHRQAAFEACQFLVDWLKTKAPFWKLEETASGPRWVEAERQDDKAAAKWVDQGRDKAAE